MEWIEFKDRLPPQNEPFLAYTTGKVEMMEWKERVVKGEEKGWFGFYCPCSCCSGHCSDTIKLWTRLPKLPEA